MANESDAQSAQQIRNTLLAKIQQTLNSGLPGLVTNGIALTNLAQIAASTILGNNTGSTANVTALTVTQVQTLLSMRWTLTVVTATNATWPVPAGTSEMLIEGWGGGGSGGASATGSTQRAAGGAGAGNFIKLYHGTMDATLNVTIGAGGAAVAASAGGGSGNTGGTTTVVGANLGTLTSNGGVGGGGPSAGGGGGGTATGGDINITGCDGFPAPTPAAQGVGFGGAAARGGGAGAANVSRDGYIPGGGGSCSNHVASNSGAGARGEVWIWTR